MKKIYLLGCLLSLSLQANEYIVIANKHLHVENITREYIKQIYLKKHKYIENTHLVPVNLQPQSSVRKSFENHILQMSRDRLKRFWTMQHYKGKRPPVIMYSSSSALQFVEKIEGALSYIPAQKLPENANVKIIYRWSGK
jgi:ABC-type phosphate transport system substrate-binding protein